jgi:hypothetical protein
VNLLTAVTGSRWRVASLALVLAGALAGSASAAVHITIDPTAHLSPGRLHVTLTGSIACDNVPGPVGLNGQVIQQGGASGWGFTSVACDGMPHLYTMDVSTGFAIFAPGPASAQVSQTTCGPVGCESMYTDAIIQLQ